MVSKTSSSSSSSSSAVGISNWNTQQCQLLFKDFFCLSVSLCQKCQCRTQVGSRTSLLSQHRLFHRSFETATISASFFSLSFPFPFSPDRTCFPDNNGCRCSEDSGGQSKAHLPSSFCPRCTVLLLSNQHLPLLLMLSNVSLLFPLPSTAADDIGKEKERRKMMAITI